MNKRTYVMVLEDGETYTLLDGCKIIVLDVDVEDADVDEIVADTYNKGETKYGKVIVTFTANKLVTYAVAGVEVDLF